MLGIRGVSKRPQLVQTQKENALRKYCECGCEEVVERLSGLREAFVIQQVRPCKTKRSSIESYRFQSP